MNQYYIAAFMSESPGYGQFGQFLSADSLAEAQQQAQEIADQHHATVLSVRIRASTAVTGLGQ